MRLLLLVPVLLMACTPPPPQVICSPTGFNISPDAGPTMQGVIGRPFAVRLAQFRPDTCSTTADVVTEVLDPLNRKVTHTHSDPTLIDLIAFNTTITFTPTMAGSHHLTARFEPSLGVAQGDVMVNVERTEAPQKTLSLGAQCRALELTSSGLSLCLVSNSRLLRVFRGDVFLQELEADEMATSADVVWTARQGKVRRQVDDGGAAPIGAGPEFVYAVGDAGLTLIAHEDEALVVNDKETVKLRFVDGGLVAVAKIDVGNRAEAIHSNASFDALLFAGGPLTSHSSRTTCTVSIPDTKGMPFCISLGDGSSTGTVLGSDSTGLWAADRGTLRHHRLIVDAGTESIRFEAEVSRVHALSWHHEQTPILKADGHTFVPRRTADGIALESYKLDPGFVLMPSSAHTVRAQHPDGRQQLFKR